MSVRHVQNTPPEPSAQASSPSGQASAPPSVDPIVLAFYLLMEASNISCQTATLQAKQLSQNAAYQQRMNLQEAALQNVPIPTKVVQHHYTKQWTPHPGPPGVSIIWTYKWKIAFNTYPNQGAILQANAQNQRVGGERQVLSEQMMVLQQQAQSQEAGVGTTVNEAMQSQQEAGSLMDTLRALTFQAVLRKPPQ